MKVQFIQTRFHSPDAHDIDSVWQLLYPEHFINVLLMHHMKRRDQKDIEEVANIMYYNDSISTPFKSSTRFKHLPRLSDNQLYYKKFKIFKISDMFESFQDKDDSIIEPKLILIDGAPGMGKTTLCKEIAYQWAKGDLLKDTKIMFLLFLCEPEIQNMHDLNDFIQYFFKFVPSFQDLDLTKCCVERFIRDNSDITILMDGYDELGDKGNDLLVTKILRRKILPQCRIVITSRPIASEKLQKLADVRVEVLGFTDDSKKEYIHKELKDDPKKVECLLSYLDNHSDINKACYVPIIMSIMVCICKECDELPTNQSEVYEQFVTSVMSRYLQTKGVLPFDKLPIKYHAYFHQLTEFAFKTMGSDKIMFSNMDIEKFSHAFASSSSELCGLGLLKVTEHFSLKKKNSVMWYNFLHLSIHEFLAAIYVKSLELSEQFKLIKTNFFAQRYLNVWILFVGLQQSLTYNFHQLSTYSHIYGKCGAAKNEMKLILEKLHSFHFSEIRNMSINNIVGTFQFLCCKSSEDNLQTHVVQENFIKTMDSLYLLPFTSNWTKLFVSLCSVTNSDQLLEIFLFDKNPQDVLYHQVVAELEKNLNLSVVLVSNDTLVGYRCNCCQLSNALKMNGSLVTVILKYCQISDDIANVLSSYLIKSHNFQCLYITDCNKSDQLALLSIIQSLGRLSTIKYLVLDNNNMTGEVAEDLAIVIKTNSSLEVLYLENSNLGPSAIIILQALKENCKLKLLNLSGNNMTGKVADNLANVIKNNPGLEQLHLFNNYLGPSAIVILQALKENSKLKLLNLNGNYMTGVVAEDLANVIKTNSHLEQLGLDSNYLGTSAIVILQALKENSKLKILILNANNMTGEVAEDLANVIKSNPGLEQLHLSNNSFGPYVIIILQVLKKSSKLQILNLNNNNMTGEVAEDLANVIKNNAGLEELYLSYNSFGPSAIMILQALNGNSKLQILNLNNNCMAKEVAEDLANVINNNPDLEQLYLSNNNLGPSAIMIVRALKESSKLQILSLNNNNMTGKVAEDLANVIKNNPDLEQLYLSNNSLGPCAIMILQALKGNSKLQILNLNSNNMTGKVAKDLANVIKNNSYLEQLGLEENNFGPFATVILQALKENSNLQVLNLINNNMTGKTAEDLANVIRYNSSLQNLYLSNNGLKHSALVIFQALKENSKLQVLNLSSNNIPGEVAIELADVIKNNPDLKELHLSNNDLGPFAIMILQILSGNSKLVVLNLGSTNLTGQIAEDLANVIKSNPHLENFYLSNNDLRSSAFLVLKALKETSKLKILQMSNDSLTKSTAVELVSVIKSNPLITDLWLGDNMLQSGLIDIAINCKHLANLQALELSHNSVCPTKAVYLASIVGSINLLQVLIFGGIVLDLQEIMYYSIFQFHDASKDIQKHILQNSCTRDEAMVELFCLEMWRSWFTYRIKFMCAHNYFPISSNMLTNLVNTIPTLSDMLSIVKQSEQKLSQLDATRIILSLSSVIETLTVLDLEYSNIKEEAAVTLAEALNYNNILEQLWLRGNMLGADGAAVILTSLQNISTLRILDLSYNNISSSSANGIAAVVNRNHFLEQLCLDGNMLMTAGVVIIASVLKKHSNLTLLSLSNNGITEDAAEEISDIVNNNSLLRGLLLDNNQLQSVGISNISKSLARIKFLHSLELTNNCIDATAADTLSLTLSICSYLKRLHLGNNNLETIGAVKVCQALKSVPILQTLSLNNNSITEEATIEICNTIITNTNLEILLLGGNDLQTNGVLKIANTVKSTNSTMQLLSLSDNSVDEQVKEHIKVMLCNLKLFI